MRWLVAEYLWHRAHIPMDHFYHWLEHFQTQTYKCTHQLGRICTYKWTNEHIFLEASRLAYADREVYIADPDFFDVPVKGLLNKNYLKQRAKLINTEKATKEIRHGDMKMYSENVLDIGVNLNFPSTTHISIVDAIRVYIY